MTKKNSKIISKDIAIKINSKKEIAKLEKLFNKLNDKDQIKTKYFADIYYDYLNEFKKVIHIKRNKKKIFVGLSCLIVAIVAMIFLIIVIPLLNSFNYLTFTYFDTFHQTSLDVDNKILYPNFLYNADPKSSTNQYDKIMSIAFDFKRNFTKFQNNKSNSSLDFFYFAYTMEKYMSQNFNQYNLKFNKMKNLVYQHSKKFLNTLPIKLLMNSGWYNRAQKYSDKPTTLQGHFFKIPNKSNWQNDFDESTTNHGFFYDNSKLFDSFIELFDAGLNKNFNNDDRLGFDDYYGNSKSQSKFYYKYYDNKKFVPIKENEPVGKYNLDNGNKEYYVHSDQKGFGVPDPNRISSDNSNNNISISFLQNALNNFSTNYAYLVQNYFGAAFNYELTGNIYDSNSKSVNPIFLQNKTKNGPIGDMIKNHSINQTDLLWLLYNHIIFSCAASFFNQVLFAPLLFFAKSQLVNALSKYLIISEDAPTKYLDYANDFSLKKLTIASSLHINNLVERLADKLVGITLPSLLFFQGMGTNLKNTIQKTLDSFPVWLPFKSKLAGYIADKIENWNKELPKFNVWPIFIHAADIVQLSKILNIFNDVLFQKASKMYFTQFINKNQTKNWDIMTSAYNGMKYYFDTCISPRNEPFLQAKGDFFCQQNLWGGLSFDRNSKKHIVPTHSFQSKIDPNIQIHCGLFNSTYTDNYKRNWLSPKNKTNSNVYGNFIEYLAEKHLDLLNVGLDSNSEFTSKKNKTVGDMLSEILFEFNPYDPYLNNIDNKSYMAKIPMIQKLYLNKEKFPASNYLVNLINIFGNNFVDNFIDIV